MTNKELRILCEEINELITIVDIRYYKIASDLEQLANKSNKLVDESITRDLNEARDIVLPGED